MVNLSDEMRGLLDQAISRKASDLHLVVGVAPILRIDGRLAIVPNTRILTDQDCNRLIKEFIPENYQEVLSTKKDLDFSFGYQSMRFRTNVFYQKGTLAASLRLIPNMIRDFSELGLPPIVEKFTNHSQGFVIIAGPTGHGKSTTLAAMINHINNTRSEHIITVEDPVEYVFEHKKSVISQREIGSDTNSFGKSLRATLREDPNVVLIGEMRDLETIEAALTIAETGHLVLTTLHTNSASQTADRIVDVFPPHQQQQIRQQLASVLLGVVSQRLMPRISGGRMLACEIMVANSAVRSLIREGKTHQLPNIIQTSAVDGMISLDKVLAELVSRGEITIDDALTWAVDPKAFKMMVY
jgi:twitching motility protein PilT